MTGAIFVFNRELVGEQGQHQRQAITIFAEDEAAARRILRENLKSLQDHSGRPEPAFQPTPAWQALEVALDGPKVIMQVVT